jgi:Spy/CpxP family protein refolding chaperone
MKLTLALLAVLALSPMAQAQTAPVAHTPPSPATMAQHQVQRYTTLLSLTSAQAEQATTFFTAEATSRQSQFAQLKTAHQALEAAIKANDTATIQSTSNTLGQMEAESIQAHATARAQFYNILNAEQKSKFAELEQEHMMGGPGGPGGRFMH